MDQKVLNLMKRKGFGRKRVERRLKRQEKKRGSGQEADSLPKAGARDSPYVDPENQKGRCDDERGGRPRGPPRALCAGGMCERRARRCEEQDSASAKRRACYWRHLPTTVSI